MTLQETVKSRFQFLATITLFFPVLIDALFKSNNLDSGKVTGMWGASITILIADYIFLECTKKLNIFAGKTINLSIFVTLGIYAFIFGMNARLEAIGHLPAIFNALYKIVLDAVWVLPLFMLAILIINPFLPKK